MYTRLYNGLLRRLHSYLRENYEDLYEDILKCTGYRNMKRSEEYRELLDSFTLNELVDLMGIDYIRQCPQLGKKSISLLESLLD